MQKFTAVGYGDDKTKLKSEIGELVRRIYRHPPRNPDRFVDLKYKIEKNKDSEQSGKYMIVVDIYHLEIKDSHFNVKRKPWKYKKAVEHDYLNWWDKRKLYGSKPQVKQRKIKL